MPLQMFGQLNYTSINAIHLGIKSQSLALSNALHLLQAHTYLSTDSVTEDDDAAAYPEEFLNTLAPSGMPPHSLTPTIGAPTMLLRNLNSTQSQANGTRLICRGFHKHDIVIDAEMCTGSHAGERVFLPKIQLEPPDDDMPFTLASRQFPIRPDLTICHDDQ